MLFCTDKFFTQRLKFVHLAIIGMFCSSVCAGSVKQDILKKFNPTYKIQTRGPQSFVADVDYMPEPERREEWLENVLVEDSAGVLVGIRDNLSAWDRQEEYIRNWNLEKFGSYSIVTAESKKAYLGKRILKYADKRLTGELKNADKGSALAAVGTAQKALRAESKVSISKNYKLKFKARVLQGKAIMKVVNPYVDYTSTYSFSSGLNMNVRKEFKAIRTVASVDYNVADGNYTAKLDKKITSSVKTRISSTQAVDSGLFTQDSNSTVQLMYSRPFNF